MKKIVVLLIIIFYTSIYSQNGWQIIYPGNNTTAITFKDITFFNSQTGWLLGDNNVTKTTNGGLNWNMFIIVHLFNQMNCFYFYNKDIGWAGENNYLNFTSNSGANWQVINTAVANPRSIYFKDLLTGWVCGDSGMIKKTTNSGYNWVTLQSGTSTSLKAISFADENTGICAGDWGTIKSTTNGGANWNTFIDNYLGFFTYVKFRNSQTGFVSGTGGNIYRTSNSGINWTPYYVNSFLVSSIQFAANGNAYAFGSSGYILNSTDNGSSWNQLPLNGLYAQVNAASITQDNNIWVAADSGLVCNSTNLGNSWNIVFRDYLTKEHLNAVYFNDQFTGFACGNKGIIIKSTNGGTNWNLSNLGINSTLKDILFVNNLTGYIAGGNNDSNGVIFRTTNGGAIWQEVYNDSSSLRSIQFINTNTGWAAGSNGHYLKTTNSGMNWIRYKHLSSVINDIWFIDNNTGFIGGTGLYRTSNSGLNWEQVSANNVTSIQFTGNTGYAMSYTGTIYYLLRSTNTGMNWVQNQIPGGTSQKLYFINDITGWNITGSTIRKTTNSGINWFIQASGGSSISANGLYFLDNNFGWCVGMYGGIIRTTSGGIGITTLSAEIPTEYKLQQNYPNPFNPETRIKFQLPFSGNVKLIIYDLTGKEIIKLIDEHLKPGTYATEWNALNFSSGVYFYSLITNDFTQTRKMVVLK